ncbi:MAG TPA: YifB family Mg chelatase-like AAA ATPase [Solirubrobacteraceae bacterium]|jgi:magnesium chelatase family protein
MLARAHAFTIDGLHTRRITVEVDIRAGLPAFTIVGLADTAVREARERIQAAIRNAGFDFPARRITANLAPGDVPKAGPGLDLALACAVLAASGQLDGAMLGRAVMLGELSLDGRVRPSRGSLAVAEATHRAGLELLALASASAREAGLIDGLRVAPVESLRSAVRVLEGGPPDPLPAPAAHPGAPRPADRCPELSDVIGQPGAVQALVVAAAGGHNCLLSGAPGTGKTMLAQRLGSILPPMSRREAIEVTRIRGLLGTPVTGLASERPFRAPHHSITAAGLIGGVRGGWAGEVLLAHNGVLFLDELSEFSRPTLDALRQPLEDGRVAVVRSRHSAVYPTRFMLMAATNPCPCGYAGEGEDCSCSPGDVARHERRLSGPLLDRIDLLVEVRRPRVSSASEEGRTTSAQARELVREARARAARRLKIDGLELNAQMDARALRSHVHLDSRAEALLGMAREQGALSCRGEARVMSVARTIADVEASARVRARDVGAALTLRGRRGRAVRHAA